MLIKKRSVSGTFFIFSTQNFEGFGFELSKKGRFSHSHDYVTSLLDISSFSIVDYKVDHLPLESGCSIKGGFYIVVKN